MNLKSNHTPSSGEKFFYAIVIPSLLVVIPFTLALILPSLFPFFRLTHGFFDINLKVVSGVNDYLLAVHEYAREILPAYVSLALGFFSFVGVYSKIYSSPGTERYFDRDPEIVIRGYEFINRVLFIEIGLFIVITILFYLLPQSLKKTSLWPLFGDGFYFVQYTLTSMIYAIIFVFFRSYLNRDFRFSLAKRLCM